MYNKNMNIYKKYLLNDLNNNLIIIFCNIIDCFSCSKVIDVFTMTDSLVAEKTVHPADKMLLSYDGSHYTSVVNLLKVQIVLAQILH